MLEQKLNSEQKDETQLPSSPNNGNTHVIGSQSHVRNLYGMPYLDEEYLKKRSQSYKAMREIICQKINIDKFKTFLKDDS